MRGEGGSDAASNPPPNIAAMARRLMILFACMLLGSACGDGGVGGAGNGDDRPMLACGDWLTFPADALESIIPASDVPGLADAIERYSQVTGWPDASSPWFLLHESGGGADVVRATASTFSLFRLEGGDGEWRGVGALGTRDCPLQLPTPDGLGLVEWSVNDETDPSTATLLLDATERGCTGGTPMGDRLVVHEVIETPATVVVVLGARPLPDDVDYTCPGNPAERVAITLGAPLGDRTVADGLATDLDLGEILLDLADR